MKVSKASESIIRELEVLLGTGKKRDAVKLLTSKLEELLSNVEVEDAIIQVDLDCGELVALWTTSPKLVNVSVVVAENPTVLDTPDSGTYIDDDHVIIKADTPELLDDCGPLREAVEEYDT